MADMSTGKVIALIRALSTSSTSSATYTVTDALVIGAATTSGVRLDLESGVLAVREGDDSAYAPMTAVLAAAGNTDFRFGGDANGFYFSDTGTGQVLAIQDAIPRLVLVSSGTYGWASGNPIGATPDTTMGRSSAGVVYVSENTNGSRSNVHQITASSGALSGASYSFSNTLPAGAIILGVTCRVTTTITGATSFDVGDGTDVDRYGATIALASGTTTTFASATASPLEWRSANGNVVLTANGSNFTGGVVRICVHYMTGTAPTS